MSQIIKLRGNLKHTPNCWQNWINDFNKRWQTDPENDRIWAGTNKHFYDAVRELQKQWHATLVGDNWDCPLDLVFNSERDYTFFVLKWS